MTTDSPPAPRRALVVDDAPTVRLYHGELLRQLGFVVEEAGNGFEALELVMSSDPGSGSSAYDLLIVDVNMPQMDGHTLVARLRGADVDADCPIVMISTEARDGDAEAAYTAGANGYLVKPVTPATLQLVATTLTGPLEHAAPLSELEARS